MFLKKRNIISKIKISKVTDYAALIFYVIHVKIRLSHGIHDIIIILMKCMIYSSKYETVAVPGRVVVERCSLDLIFLIRGSYCQLDHLGFWWGRGFFFPIDETRFS